MKQTDATYEFAAQNNEILRAIWDFLQKTDPEFLRLIARVDELLKVNTELVLENRELKGPVFAICIDSGRPAIKGTCQVHGGDNCLIDPIISHAERTSGLEAMQVLFKALGWSSGGLGSAALEIVEQRDRVSNAIRVHRAQKADDRCIEDDDRLYESLQDGLRCDRNVGDKAAMLKNCEKFIEKRCTGGDWPSYAQLEQKMAEQEANFEARMKQALLINEGRLDEIQDLKEVNQGLRDRLDDLDDRPDC